MMTDFRDGKRKQTLESRPHANANKSIGNAVLSVLGVSVANDSG